MWDRSEHAKNIDHAVTMTLVNKVSGDMSSLVRKELVAALQWVVLAFEHAFLNIAANDSSNQASSKLFNIPATSIKRTDSRYTNSHFTSVIVKSLITHLEIFFCKKEECFHYK